MMIGKRVLDDVAAQLTQRGEKTFRRADAGHGMHASQCGQEIRSAQVEGVVQIPHAGGPDLEAELADIRCAIHRTQIHRAGARHRFPQRPCRQAQAIAPATPAIDEQDFEIAVELVVLQSVVADQHVAIVGLQQQPPGAGAVRPRRHRQMGATGNERWLIAYFIGVAGFRDQHRPVRGVSAIATAQHAGTMPFLPEQFRQPDHERRFAGTADCQIAHHHDGDRQTCARAVQLAVSVEARAGAVQS